ncbi:MAG: tetratricopeptide repeat protein [Herminiimonas sp.]|uniref:tetratricopeptide repeat protein n=1 Tax=Herminiimonas sp. TaxID=1926289 RepID=UPI00272325FA|nr:tetratricopeptide repeat protein [Herminiimonas sp.]MDO9421456.1 tetratricopeptide repeat protein [Herminiimonas sp.]
MSLLMQALKKAENAKQKQGDQSDAPTATDPVATADTPTPPYDLEAMPLTLQPQEPSSVEQQEAISAAAQESSKVSTSSLDYFSTPPTKELSKAEQQAALEADSGLAPKPPETPSAPAAEVPPQPTPGVLRAKETATGGGTHGKLKIGLDEKQSAAIEAKKKLAARNAAKSVFDAKQKSPNRRAIVIGLLGLIILASAGAYTYLSIVGIDQKPLMNVAAVAPAAPAVVTPMVEPVTDPFAQTSETKTEISPDAPLVAGSPSISTELPVVPATSMSTMPGTTTVAVIPQNRNALAAPSPVVTAPAPLARATAAPATRPLTSAQPPLSSMAMQSDSIQIRRTNASLQLNPTLSSAYQAFTAGDLNSANSQYQKVLQQEPNNRDALLGIAAIAINRGQNAQAGSFYNRLLELDPNDAEASAGIASLDQNDPSRAESRLKKILSKNPNSAPTLFTLGNVYAEQSRWSEAQQFYFRAFGAAPGNADYAYNLAISLDKLDQPRLALEYYQRALEISQKSGGNLDKTTVINRIQALQSMPQT